MAKALTKSQIAATIAEKVGLTKKQAVEILEALVELAYKNAKNSFTIPGLGKLVLVNRKARMGRNPATGATIKIAAKRVVKFRVAKAAKDAILGEEVISDWKLKGHSDGVRVPFACRGGLCRQVECGDDPTLSERAWGRCVGEVSVCRIPWTKPTKADL